MSEAQNSSLENGNILQDPPGSNFKKKDVIVQKLAFATSLLILIGISLFIFFTPNYVAQFPKFSISSQRRVSLLESSPDSTSFWELQKHLDCVAPLKRTIKSLEIDDKAKDVGNFLVNSLTVGNRDLFLKSHQHRNIIRSAEDLHERLRIHRRCATNVTLPTVGICSLQRDTGPFVQEWLAFYLLHGVSKIFIYENSIPNSLSYNHFRYAVKPFVDSGYVVVRDWADSHNQNGANNDCLQRAKKSMDWLAFFDYDEYLIVKEPGPVCLPEFLNGYKEFPGLVIKWRVMTPRGVVRHDFNQLFLEQYLWSDLSMKEGKSILQTRFEITLTHVHILYFQDGHSSVCPNKQVCPSHDYSENPYEFAELRHFWGADWGFTFFVKICGGSPKQIKWLYHRMELALQYLVTDCCSKFEGKTRQEVSLRAFLFGES